MYHVDLINDYHNKRWLISWLIIFSVNKNLFYDTDSGDLLSPIEKIKLDSVEITGICASFLEWIFLLYLVEIMWKDG